MSDKSILQHINDLVEEEHRLRADAAKSPDTHERIQHVAEQLDQCWDLLRQRRAKVEFGNDPGTAEVRDVKTVKTYIG